MSDVFIAHVEEDAEVALEIALGLEEAGYSTWCYEVDSIPGPSYLIQTGRAVAASKVVVVIIRRSYNPLQISFLNRPGILYFDFPPFRRRRQRVEQLIFTQQ